MNTEQLQGLLYLSTGALFFLCMMVFLRFLQSRKESYEQNSNLINSANEKPELKIENDFEVKILDIVDMAFDIKLFRLQKKDKSNFTSFKPGQFITLDIPYKEKITKRSYSIMSSATNLSTIEIAVKQLSGGIGSTWLHAQKRGAILKSSQISGSYFDDSPYDSIYIAAGVGITPILSMLQSAINSGTTKKMALFYSAKTVEELVFLKLIEYLVEIYPRLILVPIVTKDESWQGEKERININQMTKYIDVLDYRKVYICGPEKMANSLTLQLTEAGLRESNIHFEKFVSPSMIEIEPRSAKIIVNEKTLEYEGSDSILDFLEKNNVDIDSSCRSGVCEQCKCTLISGEVESFADSSNKDGEQKSILTCVSYPKKDEIITMQLNS